jgi:tetratricopeptide (TPR) repeat protein
VSGHEGAQAWIGLCLCAFVTVVTLFLREPHALQAQSPGLGRISFPTSGSPAAQPLFIRGVLLLHSFEYDDAIDAFRDAERIDPVFVMAYWGEAMCYNQPLWFHEDAVKARDALARLDTARANGRVTAREQRYITAIESLFGEGDKPTRDRAYTDQMGDLARAYPDDDEAAAFYALALLATVPPTQPNADVSLKAGAIASAILERNPQHPGAAHYALHAYGDGQHAAMGLKAARTYARIAPASSHARHMPSHVFLPLGMWDEAAMADESAFAASAERVKRHGASPAQLDFHSLSWLQYEYLQQGRFAKARELLEPMRQALTAPSASNVHTHVESEIGRGFAPMALQSELASMRARLVVESGNWTEMKGRGTFDNVDELFALGLASAKLGDLKRAEAALEHMGKAVDAAPDPDNRQLTRIMHLELSGALKAAAGATTQALAALEESVAIEANRPRPNARPYPIKPAGELYAETLLATGNARAAVKAFQTSLGRTPRRAASLIGLARAARTAGLTAEARRAAREFLAIWRLADSDRAEIKEARTIVTPR